MGNASPKSKRSSKSAQRQQAAKNNPPYFMAASSAAKADLAAAKNHKFSLDFTKLSTGPDRKSPLPSSQNVLYNKYQKQSINGPSQYTMGPADPSKERTSKQLRAYNQSHFTSRRPSSNSKLTKTGGKYDRKSAKFN